MTVTLEQMEEVARRFPVEIECRHAIVMDSLLSVCSACNMTLRRPATAADLMQTEADGWPAAPMRAWWGRYGGQAFSMNGTHMVTIQHPKSGLMGYWGDTYAAAMQAAAVAMVAEA